MKNFLTIAAAAASLLVTSAWAELPQVSNARVIQPPPGAKVAAVYLTLSNSSDQPLNITGALSDAAKQVEVHLSTIENDVARMQKQDVVIIPPGESLDFTHGSYHVMLMGLSSPLKAGTTLDMSLETSAGILPISVPVITPDEGSAMTHDMHPGMKKGEPVDEAMSDTMKHSEDKMKSE